MKNILLPVLFAAVLYTGNARAQLYEMESSRNMDLSTKSTRMEKVSFTIDSTKMSLHSGDRTYYYDATSFNLDDNGVINMVALDLNDEKVMIKFSPGANILEYYLGEFGIRYFLDKVEMPEPEAEEGDSLTAKTDSVSEEDEAMRLDTMIYESAEVMPEYPGGKTDMMAYFTKSVKIPSQAKKDGIKGFVQVDIIVEKDGSVKYAKVRKDIGGGCGAEAVRVVKQMPKWAPGEKNGEVVRVKVPVTVSFMPK